MKLAFFFCAMLAATLLGVCPGEGPGFQDHPEGFLGSVRDRSSHCWMTVSLSLQQGLHYMDCLMDLVLDDSVEGLNPSVIKELHEKRWKGIEKFLAVMIMIVGSATMLRKAAKRSFYEERKYRQKERKAFQRFKLPQKPKQSEKAAEENVKKKRQKRRRH